MGPAISCLVNDVDTQHDDEGKLQSPVFVCVMKNYSSLAFVVSCCAEDGRSSPRMTYNVMSRLIVMMMFVTRE